MLYRCIFGWLTLVYWQPAVISTWTVPEMRIEEEDPNSSVNPTPQVSFSPLTLPVLTAKPLLQSTASSEFPLGTPRLVNSSPVNYEELGASPVTFVKLDEFPVTERHLEEVAAVTDNVIEASVVDFNNQLEEESYFDSSMHPAHTAYLGKTAVLTCIVHAAKSDKSVSWIRSRDLRILTVGRYTYTSDLRFEALHTEGSSEWTLRIRSVQLRDQGNYECQITTKPIRTFTVFLNVVEPTVEVLGAPDLFVNRASMINLTCIVHHAPFPPEAITWYHNNKTISYTSPRGGVSVVEERGETTTSFLLLQNAQATDSGSFTCRPEGMEAAVVMLHVLDGEHPAAMQTNSSVSQYPTLSKIVGALFATFLYHLL